MANIITTPTDPTQSTAPEPTKTVASGLNPGKASSIAKGPARINQEGERLFTVRPRYYASTDDNPTRGEAATLRLVMSEDPDADAINAMTAGMPYYEAVAFKRMMNQDEGKGGYKDFLLTDLAYDIQEKYQVFHTFGGHECVYFYGQSPLAIRVSGLLTDDLDNDQFARFAQMYTKHLRGTKAAQNYSLVELALPNATFFGSITSFSIQQNSNRDTDVSFSMGFLVKETIFRSTDAYFENDSGEVTDYQDENFLGSRQTPTITTSNIYEKYNSMMSDFGEMIGYSDPGGGLNLAGIYTQAINSIPTMKDLLGIGPEDIAAILSEWNNVLNDILSVPNAIINKVNSYVDEATSYLTVVERGLDEMMDTVTGTVGAAFGMVDHIQDAVGQFINFPQTIASKVGRFLDNGFMTPDGADGSILLGSSGGNGASDSTALVGGSRMDAATAAALLQAGSRADPGPDRGATIRTVPINVGIVKNPDEMAVLPQGATDE